MYTYVSFIAPSAVAALAVSLLQRQNDKKNCDENEEERTGRLTQNGSEDREPKYSHYLMKSAGRLMSTRDQWLAKQRIAVSRNGHILTFGEVFKTLLTSWNSFNVPFAILLTLLNMADRPNSMCHAYKQ